jgi:hypothetical protein
MPQLQELVNRLGLSLHVKTTYPRAEVKRVGVARAAATKLLLGGLAPSLLCACGSSFEYRARPYSGERWDVGAIIVAIHDPRPRAAVRPPAVPAITTGGGQGTEVRLPPEFPAFVQYRLGQLGTRTGPPVKLDIIVNKAHATWSASALEETQKASVAMRFRIHGADGRLLGEGTGVGMREFSSTDASDTEGAKVFRAACYDAFDQFFGDEANIILLNSRR